MRTYILFGMEAEITDGRRLRGERSRRAILEQAVRIASVEGLEGLTLGKVSAAAGVPKSTLQVLFRDRESLQAQTLETGVAMFTDRLVAELAPAQTPLQRLRALTEGWFDLVAHNALPGGCLVTAAAGEYRARPGPLQDLVKLHQGRWRDLLVATVRAAAADGALKPGVDPDQLVFEIMALQGAANVAAGLEGPDDFARARRAVARLLADATA
ncbi:MAG TPA: TetR/AcrR family transcriptional regulator [Phenylobacterium sp.]|nr:TetR/AcrR family transcriptional regulator [Phenylobacterium sp.]